MVSAFVHSATSVWYSRSATAGSTTRSSGQLSPIGCHRRGRTDMAFSRLLDTAAHGKKRPPLWLETVRPVWNQHRHHAVYPPSREAHRKWDMPPPPLPVATKTKAFRSRLTLDQKNKNPRLMPGVAKTAKHQSNVPISNTSPFGVGYTVILELVTLAVSVTRFLASSCEAIASTVL